MSDPIKAAIEYAMHPRHEGNAFELRISTTSGPTAQCSVKRVPTGSDQKDLKTYVEDTFVLFLPGDEDELRPVFFAPHNVQMVQVVWL